MSSIFLLISGPGPWSLDALLSRAGENRESLDDSDAFLALPGGIGTLDELFEAWSWNALGYHKKPFCLLNVAVFWDGMVTFIDDEGKELKAGGKTEVWAGPSLAYGRGRFWLAATFGLGLTDDTSQHRGRVLFGLTL